MANFARRLTAGAIVQEALAMQGLPVPATVASNPADVSAQQCWALLRNLGRRLCKPMNGYRWQVLTREWVLTTDPTKTVYDLPEDFDSFEDLTGWNFTSRLPMLGPATDAQWQCLKARALGSSTISVIYRSSGGKFELYDSPSASQELHINYTSRAWVRASNQPAPPAPEVFFDAPQEDGDLVLFDPELMVSALMLAFQTAKGFDTTAADASYRRLLEAAICADTDAPVLSVNKGDTYPLISTQFNVPDTGYGV